MTTNRGKNRSYRKCKDFKKDQKNEEYIYLCKQKICTRIVKYVQTHRIDRICKRDENLLLISSSQKRKERENCPHTQMISVSKSVYTKRRRNEGIDKNSKS